MWSICDSNYHAENDYKWNAPRDYIELEALCIREINWQTKFRLKAKLQWHHFTNDKLNWLTKKKRENSNTKRCSFSACLRFHLTLTPSFKCTYTEQTKKFIFSSIRWSSMLFCAHSNPHYHVTKSHKNRYQSTGVWRDQKSCSNRFAYGSSCRVPTSRRIFSIFFGLFIRFHGKYFEHLFMLALIWSCHWHITHIFKVIWIMLKIYDKHASAHPKTKHGKNNTNNKCKFKIINICMDFVVFFSLLFVCIHNRYIHK